MTAKELYELLDKAGVVFDVVEIYQCVRVLNVVVDEEPEDEE